MTGPAPPGPFERCDGKGTAEILREFQPGVRDGCDQGAKQLMALREIGVMSFHRVVAGPGGNPAEVLQQSLQQSLMAAGRRVCTGPEQRDLSHGQGNNDGSGGRV